MKDTKVKLQEIKFDMGDRMISLSLDEAKQLYRELKKLFDSDSQKPQVSVPFVSWHDDLPTHLKIASSDYASSHCGAERI